MADQVPAEVVKERYQRLVELVDDIAWDEAKKQVGRTVDVLVAEGEGRKDEATGRLSGRAADNRLVHFAVNARLPDAGGVAAGNTGDLPRPGDMASVEVTYGAPHHLVADGPVCSVRRTAAGDAWERRQSEVGCGPVVGAGATSDVGPVVLGLPTVGATQVL